MKWMTAVYTNAGGRGVNEDSAGYHADEDGRFGIWIVADGLGGHADGEKASRLAVETCLSMFAARPSIEQSDIEALVATANARILEAQTDRSGMKTTLAGLFIVGNEARWAHLGDTRLYYFTNNRLAVQTLDHSVSQYAVTAGEITADEIRFHADRSKLLKALGDREEIAPGISGAVSLSPGDAFLLCTDGFWEYVYETEMEIDLAKASGPEEWLSFLTGRLMARVCEDNDNNTAIAVFVK